MIRVGPRLSNADDILAKLSPCFLLSNIGRHFDLKQDQIYISIFTFSQICTSKVITFPPLNLVHFHLPEINWQVMVEEHSFAEVQSTSLPGALA